MKEYSVSANAAEISSGASTVGPTGEAVTGFGVGLGVGEGVELGVGLGVGAGVGTMVDGSCRGNGKNIGVPTW